MINFLIATATMHFRLQSQNLCLLLTLTILIPLGSSASCYYPSRNLASGDSVCQPKADVSACCGPGYACLGNLLCRKTKESSGDSLAIGAVVRGSCTDQTFSSPSCPQFCRSAGSMFIESCYVIDKYYLADQSDSQPSRRIRSDRVPRRRWSILLRRNKLLQL